MWMNLKEEFLGTAIQYAEKQIFILEREYERTKVNFFIFYTNYNFVDSVGGL